MKFAFLMSVVILAGLSGQAHELVCSSSDSKIQYKLDETDGGAPRRPYESLRVNGQDIISVTTPGGAEYRIGSIQLLNREQVTFPKISGDYETVRVKFSAKVLNNNGSLLISEPILCDETIYVGAPRPSAPPRRN